jgi:hypothetical protein
MTAGAAVNPIFWIRDRPRRPLCDVPWIGTAVVLSDGRVHFCCFSNAVVGNVHEQPFEQAIRRALSEQRMPPECQSAWCPIYRGDEVHYLFERMDGRHGPKITGREDPHAPIRERLEGSTLVLNRDVARPGDRLEARLELRVRGEGLTADLFAAIAAADSRLCFLPKAEAYAVPFDTAVFLQEERPLTLELWQSDVDGSFAPGQHTLCAALFECGSNPNLLSNCYWSDSRTFRIEP